MDYRALICDLDGVVYRGPLAVPGAVEALSRLTHDGLRVVYATNNASRTPGDVAEHLVELGLECGAASIVTSSQAAAAHLASRLGTGAPVLSVGGPGVREAIAEVGLVPVPVRDPTAGNVEAIVQGLGVDVTWTDLAEVSYLVQTGVAWVATNLDLTLPTARGFAPGNGSLVAAVRATTDVVPHVVGKPAADLYRVACERLGVDVAHTLACGDRLDTDIVGAAAAGIDSLVVLSGVATLRDVAFAEGPQRPTYVGRDVAALLEPLPRLGPVADDRARIDAEGHITVGAGRSTPDLLAAVVSCAWSALDAGRPVSPDSDHWNSLAASLGVA